MTYKNFDALKSINMGLLETEEAIFFIKNIFQKHLKKALNLTRVSAPLFVAHNSGLQDNLNGIEKPINFTIKTIEDEKFEIIQSLAKWKRFALAKYNIPEGKGIYTDMNAIRPDEETLSSDIHSVYVDQWDWEKSINKKNRNIRTLQSIVNKIYKVFRKVEEEIYSEYRIEPFLPEKITFIHTEELYQQFPDHTPKEREYHICKKHKAVFLIGIGGALADGHPHDGRAPDYDDWTTSTYNGFQGLNGDIIVWNPTLENSFELSSMGIRVDSRTLLYQLRIMDCMERRNLLWHKKLLSEKFPESIGGGIGQSRLCMFLLRKRHIGEVQASVWPESVKIKCKKKEINLL